MDSVVLAKTLKKPSAPRFWRFSDLHIPVNALRFFTFLAFAGIGWKLLRWAARVFFGWKFGWKRQHKP
jgi:hypothetical protein